MEGSILDQPVAQLHLQTSIPESPISKSSVPDSHSAARSLSTAPSVFLDIVRFLAAVTVAIGHLSENTFTTGWPQALMSCAEGAVAVFFVLSGFMIRYVTTVKYGDLRRFTVDRVARIYSVAIPAIALTILFDSISAHINPGYYAAFGSSAERIPAFLPFAKTLFSLTWFRALFRIVLSLAMLSQSWFRDSSPLSNSPFWSLSYECVYYALFGIALYLRGRKRVVACIVLFLLIGPTIFLMFPLWLLGCAAYDAYRDGISKRSIAKLLSLSLLSIACVHGAPALINHFHAHWFYIGRMVPWMDTASIATVAVVLPLCLWLRNIQISEDHLAIRIIRKVAAATFPLYLIHFPLFVLLAAVVPYPHASLWAKLALLGTALTLSILLAGPCDAFKDYLRHKLLPRRTPSPAAAFRTIANAADSPQKTAVPPPSR
jgi:peptidoglycan/LPS O-acetylase OafA/YrhL